MGHVKQDLNAIEGVVSAARHIVALSGAGMSQDSGLPVYRGASNGLWNQTVMQDVATAKALHTHPHKVWNWLEELAASIRQAQPNAGHRALAQMEQHCKVSVFTQNVDDLHERAGSTSVTHLHGSVFHYRCTVCARPFVPSSAPNLHAVPWASIRECEHCSGPIRHDVVLFDEALRTEHVARARSAIKECDVVLVIGTSNTIYPAADLPRYALKRHKYVVEINPRDTAISGWVAFRINACAAQALPAVVDRTWGISEDAWHTGRKV